MPELPEVETVVRDLRPLLIGRTFTALRRGKHNLRKPWKKAWDAQVAGANVEAIRRRGKWIIVDLHGGRRLLVHLGMTGQFYVATSHEPAETHTHLVFSLDDGKYLRFRDVRRFGSAQLYPDETTLADFFVRARLGPEPWDLERRAWHERLKTTDRALKAVLLDQQVVAGVGNIYADESLFTARLHPARRGRQLKPAEAERLRKAIVAVLERAIGKRGSSIRDYLDGSGNRGGFQEEFRVYSRTGKPCVRCRAPIVRIILAGRSTHFCPSCQPLALSSQRSSNSTRRKLIAES